MIRRVFLDLDDTLNSLTLFILGQVRGLDIGPYDYHRFPVEVGYDIMAAYEKLKREQPASQYFPEYTVETFWMQGSMPKGAWSQTPKSKQFDWLIQHAERLVGRENVCILTTPTKDPESLAGKLEWIHDFLPSWLHRQYLVGPRKHFCARHDALLVDDSDEQVNKFRENGGQAILVPRPWNTNHHLNTNEHLAERFRHYDAKRVRAAARLARGVKPLQRLAA